MEYRQESLVEIKANKAVDRLDKIASGEDPSLNFESNLAPRLKEIFVEELYTSPNSKAGMEHINAINSIKDAIDNLGKKDNISQQEQELLDKLSEFFSYAIKATPNIEQVGNVISILEYTKSAKAIQILEDFYKNPLGFIDPKKKTILRDNAFVQNRAKVNEMGASAESSESIISKYVQENLKPASMRSLIKLKIRMGEERSPEEQEFYDAHREKF